MSVSAHNQIVQCEYLTWRLYRRRDIWYADGRSNSANLGRHSLATSDRTDALRQLHKLDSVWAVRLGIAPKTILDDPEVRLLEFAEARRLYETNLAKPRVLGGVQASTVKRYKAVLDKFSQFLESRSIIYVNDITTTVVTAYIRKLSDDGYREKTLVNEITTLKQMHKWLIEEGHLVGCDPIKVRVRRVESERAYCYTQDEVAAMLKLGRSQVDLAWLADVLVTLACTGLRISEAVSLRWSDVDLENGRLRLTDESGYGESVDTERRRLKSGRSREFPLHADLLQVLASKKRLGPYVFYGPKGGRLKADTVRRSLVERIINPLKDRFPGQPGARSFGDGRLHSFRHYFCSRCANEGVPERMVMEWLGHSDSDMIRVYYHLNDVEARHRMNGVDFLGGTAAEQ